METRSLASRTSAGGGGASPGGTRGARGVAGLFCAPGVLVPRVHAGSLGDAAGLVPDRPLQHSEQRDKVSRNLFASDLSQCNVCEAR